MRIRAFGMIVLMCASAGVASAGGIKWKKTKWTGDGAKGNVLAPDGWTLQEPYHRELNFVDASGDPTKVHVAFATGRVWDGMVLKERLAFDLIPETVKVTMKGKIACVEGDSSWVDAGEAAQHHIIRCGKLVGKTHLLAAAMHGPPDVLAQLGGMKALLKALPAVTGLTAPTENES